MSVSRAEVAEMIRRAMLPRPLEWLSNVASPGGRADGNALVWVDADKKWKPGKPSPIENVNTVAASGSAQTLPDVTTATMHDITLTANCTFTFPAASAGKSFSVRLAQDATGSRTVTWPGTVKWAGGTAPTLSTAASAVDAFALVCIDGTHWLGFFAGKGMA